MKHHAALLYTEVAPFVAELRDRPGTAARALEFLILTAARTGEVIGARRTEIDLKTQMWIVPRERMKGGREHRVALSDRAATILKELPDCDSEFVFTGPDAGPLSNMAMLSVLRRMKRRDLTVHGFRSTFRDWAAEATTYPGDVVEMALAHALPSRVEAAYRRGDLLEKRRRLMEDWARYCETTPAPNAATVVPIRARG